MIVNYLFSRGRRSYRGPKGADAPEYKYLDRSARPQVAPLP